jgi:hypothetical protein
MLQASLKNSPLLSRVERRRNSNIQIPMTKQAPNLNVLSTKQNLLFWSLDIGICLEFGAWDLEFL